MSQKPFEVSQHAPLSLFAKAREQHSRVLTRLVASHVRKIKFSRYQESFLALGGIPDFRICRPVQSFLPHGFDIITLLDHKISTFMRKTFIDFDLDQAVIASGTG